MHPKRRGIFLAFFCAMMARPGRILWSWQLLRLLMRALRPTPRGILQGRRSLRPTICEGAKPPLHSPMRGRSAPPPRVTFSPMRKSPKNLQGLRPLEPAGAKSPPFSRLLRSAPARAGLVSATDAAGFATLRWCGQLAAPSPWALTKRNILLLIRGAGVLVARLDATFRGIRGIGEGVVVQRAGGLCSLCSLCSFCAPAQQFLSLIGPRFTPLPRHGLKAGGVTSATPGEKTRPIYSQTQVANPSGSVAQALLRG